MKTNDYMKKLYQDMQLRGYTEHTQEVWNAALSLECPANCASVRLDWAKCKNSVEIFVRFNKFPVKHVC